MPTSAEGRVGRDSMVTASGAGRSYAVDTSVAVPYLDAAHSAHRLCVETITEILTTSADTGTAAGLALAGHAAFESFSVLTRLPGPMRITPTEAVRALTSAFPDPCWLGGKAEGALLKSLEHLGISGGMIYDGLVAEAARAHGRVLLTRDRRAIATYELLGVDHRVIA